MATPEPATVPAPAAPEPPPTTAVLGVPLAVTDYEGAMDWMDATIAARAKGYVCVASVHTVTSCREDPELRAAVLGSSLTVPDGQPLVWALNALGHRLSDRVYGPELMARHCARSARDGTRIYLYGGRSPGALRRLADNLRGRFPSLQIVGGHAPPFRPLTPEEERDVVADINRVKADVVWVGIGMPKQEKWMRAMRGRLEAPVLVGVGAAFDFHAGLVRQAPPRLQAAGLEWAYRLAREPCRLWRRYAHSNPRFVVGFLRQYARHRLRRAGVSAARGRAPDARSRRPA
jgi:N-acetylglucosaminyldiphosphoundecaprenol N-acetyl-beta-D-mannosaminyltransferase